MNHISGRHLIVDAYVQDGSVLEDPDSLCRMFDVLVDALGMKYLQRPAAYRVPPDPNRIDSPEDDGGWSVICQITTSHIALHGWPLRKAVMLDVFSCREFDVDVAFGILQAHLGITEANVRNIERTDPRLQPLAQSQDVATSGNKPLAA